MAGKLFVRALLGKINHHEVAVKGSGETVPSGDASLRFGGAGPEGLAEKTTVNTRELAPLGEGGPSRTGIAVRCDGLSDPRKLSGE